MRKAVRPLVASLILVCLIALTALAAVLLDRSLGKSMRELQASTIRLLETSLGRSISYRSISPSILRSIEIRDLAIHDDTDPEGVLLTIRKVRISYSLWTLLTRGSAEKALREIHVENTQLDVDMDRDKDLIDLLNRILSGGGGEGGLGIRISGSNVSATVKMQGTTLSLSNLFFTVDNARDSLAVSVRGGASGSIGDGFSFDSSVKVQGKVGRQFDWSDVTVNVLSFSSPVLKAGRQTYQVVWRNGGVEVRKIWDHSPVDIKLAADLAKGGFRVDFRSQDFLPSSLFSFSGWASTYNKWLSAPVTATGYVSYQNGGLLDYDVSMDAFLSDQLPVHDVELSGRVHGSQKTAFLEGLSLRSESAGNAVFTGDIALDSFLPQGSLALNDLRVLGTAPISGGVMVSRRDKGLEIQGKGLRIGDIPLDPLDLSLTPDKDREDFTLSLAFSGEDHPHQIKVDGSIRLGKKPDLTLSAAFTNVPANRLLALAADSGGLSGVERAAFDTLQGFGVNTRASLTTNFSTFALSAPAVSLSRWDDPKTNLQFALSLNEKTVSVSGFTGSWGTDTIRGDFSGEFTPGGGMKLAAGLTYRNTPYLIDGRYSPQSGLSLQGSYGLAISIVPITMGYYSFHAAADHIPVPMGDAFRKLSVDLEGRFTPDTWWVSCPSLTLYDLPLILSTRNTLELSAVLLPGKLTVTRTRFTDETSTLDGSGSATYRFEEGSPDAGFLDTLSGELSFDMKGGSESYTVQGSASRGSLDVKASFKGVPLTRVGTSVLAGQLAGSVRLTGRIQNPVVEMSAALAGGRVGTNPVSLSASASIAGGTLELKSLSAGYLTHTISGTVGTYNFQTGQYLLTTNYRGEMFQDSLESAVRLEGSIKMADLGKPKARFLDSDITGLLTLSGNTVNTFPFPTWLFNVKSSQGTLHVDGGPRRPNLEGETVDESSIHLSLTAANEFTIGLDRPNPVFGTAKGRITGDRIESSLDVEGLDARILNDILKSRILSFTSGTASGQLAIVGPINDPDFNGSLQLVGGGLTCVYVGDEAGPVSTILMFKGKSFTFPMVFAPVGQARMSAAGSFTIDHWIPRSFELSLRTENNTLARVRGRFGSVRLDGLASADLLISGGEAKTEVKGALTVSDCRITLGQYTWSGPFVPEETPTFINLQVTTGKRVEFNWPSIELPVIRTTAKTGNTVSVTYRGDTGAYTVKGAVDVQGGEIYYFDRSFIVKSGKLALDENQESFDPRITAHAEIRERDPKDNEEVKIYLNADNKLSMFSPSFTSDPSRSTAEIMEMIGAPLVSRAETQGIGLSAVMLGSDIPIQFGILRPFEQKVRETLGLDTFSLRTQVIQNIIASKLFGMETNPLDNTSLSLGKYLGNDLFVEMLIRMQAQPSLQTVPGTIAGLKADLEINLEWATPFFILDWSFAPKTPQSLFIPDNSISLNWRISY